MFARWIKVSDLVRSDGSGFGSVACVHGKYSIQPVNMESKFILEKKIERELPRYDCQVFFLVPRQALITYSVSVRKLMHLEHVVGKFWFSG
ncbi:hypothetical protein MUK42_36905 [Musa troglodytarum]|uniref:Uncharacterized protein n=1 Tax=Musa troglodytarum TaxID=320322 RepID=A0A9E7FFV0_9LILI|nr:hypothetical protein MUK42_36905 [Musa troglodytarum]